jgi:hypothetical protein
MPPAGVFMTTEELSVCDGLDGRRLCTGINGKVIEIPPLHHAHAKFSRIGACVLACGVCVVFV